jgi:hypothetical protein
MPRRLAFRLNTGQVCGPAFQGISDVMRSVGRTGWDCPIPTSPIPLQTMLLDARVHDARHLRRREGGCVLSFALSCHEEEAEVLLLIHDYAGRIS